MLIVESEFNQSTISVLKTFLKKDTVCCEHVIKEEKNCSILSGKEFIKLINLHVIRLAY